jgi:hypothetical protein
MRIEKLFCGLFVFSTLMFLSIFVDAVSEAQTPSPFTPKAAPTPTPPPPTIERAVVIRTDAARLSGMNNTVTASATYRILAGDEGPIIAAGVGPKTAGIYDVEFPQRWVVVIHEYHPGSADPAKRDIKYTLNVTEEDAPTPHNQYNQNVVDGRRLLIFSKGSDRTFNSVAVDRATGKETRYLLHASADVNVDDLGLGIYDFLIDKGGINVYAYTLRGHDVRDGQTIRVYWLDIVEED